MFKRKIFYIVFSLMFICFCICGCSKEYHIPNDEHYGEEGENTTVRLSSQTRKIIYQVSAWIITDDPDITVDLINNNLESDEWADKEIRRINEANLIIRVKTERLNEFISDLYNLGEIKNYTKEATDVSLHYQSTENKIASLEAERNRLMILYNTADISAIIQINKRMAEIDLILGELEGTLIQYDSLINYSTVSLRIIGTENAVAMPFGKRLGNALTGAFNALIDFFKFLIIAVTVVLPFSVIIVPAIFIFVFIRKKRKHKV